jgi:hypothetical protein
MMRSFTGKANPAEPSLPAEPPRVDPAPPSGRRYAAEGAIILALVMLTLLTRILWRYRGGVGEPDVMVMAAGLARALHSAGGVAQTMDYGRQFSPGIYLLFRCFQDLLPADPSHTLSVLNALGLAAGSLLPWPLYLIFRRTLKPAAAAAGVLLTVASPLIWETTLYFHPIVPATLLLLLALLSYGRIRPSVSGAGFALLTGLLGLCAVLMRAEILLAAPALLLLVLLSSRRKRDLLLAGGLSLGVALSSIAVLRGLSSGSSSAWGEIPAYIRQYLERYMRPSMLPRSLFWTTLGIGLGTVLGVLAALAARFSGRAGRSAAQAAPAARSRRLVLLVWIAVPLLFWLPNPVPRMRHYFLVVPALVWILGETVLARLSFRALARTVLLLLLVNLAIPDAFYRLYNRTHPQSPKTPLGSFFAQREATTQEIEGEHRLEARIEDLLGDARAPSPAEGPKVAVQTAWIEYGYLRYWLAAHPERFREEDAIAPADNVLLLRYRVGRSVLCLLYSGPLTWDPVKEAVLSQVARLTAEGYTVLISAPLARACAPDDRRIEGVLLY